MPRQSISRLFFCLFFEHSDLHPTPLSPYIYILYCYFQYTTHMYITERRGEYYACPASKQTGCDGARKGSFIQQMQNSTSSCCVHPTSEMCKGAQMRTLQLAGRMNEGWKRGTLLGLLAGFQVGSGWDLHSPVAEDYRPLQAFRWISASRAERLSGGAIAVNGFHLDWWQPPRPQVCAIVSFKYSLKAWLLSA